MTDYKEQRQTATPRPDETKDPRHDAKQFTLNGKPAYFWSRSLTADELRWIERNV